MPSENHNTWISDLLKEWQRPPTSFVISMQKQGVEILNRLIHYPKHLPKTPSPTSTVITDISPLSFKIHPTLVHVIDDLIHSTKRKVGDLSTAETVTSASNAEIVNALMNSDDEKWAKKYSTIAVYDLHSSSPTGISMCGLEIPLNSPFSESSGMSLHMSYEGSEKPTWTSVIVPRAGITTTHVDEWAGSVYIGHINGEKLWFFWPPTESNMEKFSEGLLGHSKALSIVDAIDQLEGLEVLFLDDTQLGFVMPPATIHAVMTFTKSATHGGFYLTTHHHFDLARKTTKFIMEKISSLKQDGLSLKGENGDIIIQELQKMLDCWRHLGEKMTASEDRRDSGTRILEWVDTVRSELNILIISRPWLDPPALSPSRGKARTAAASSKVTKPKK